MAYTYNPPIAQPTLLGSPEALKRGKHFITASHVPTRWLIRKDLMWNNEPLKLPNDDSGQLLRGRGEDIPIFPKPAKQSPKTAWPTSKGFGTLTIAHMKPDGTVRSAFYWGGRKRTLQEGQVRFSVQMDTQLPSLTLQHDIKLSNGKQCQHQVMLTGNTSMKDVAYFDPASVKAGDLKVPIPEELDDAAKAGKLRALTLDFGTTKAEHRDMHSVTVHYGSEIDRWSSSGEMRNTLRFKENLAQFDLAVWRLFLSPNIKIVCFQEIATPDLASCVKNFNDRYEYWVRVMKLSIRHGPFWFYKIQDNFAHEQVGAQFAHWTKANPPPVAPWLVKRFMATVTDAGLEKLQPVEWGCIIPDPLTLNQREWRPPHQDISIMLHELNSLREAARKHMSSQRMFASGRQCSMVMKPTGSDRRWNWYCMEITAPAPTKQGKPIQATQSLGFRPARDATVSVSFRIGYQNRDMTCDGRNMHFSTRPEQDELVLDCKFSKAENQIIRENLIQDRVLGECVVSFSRTETENEVSPFVQFPVFAETRARYLAICNNDGDGRA